MGSGNRGEFINAVLIAGVTVCESQPGGQSRVIWGGSSWQQGMVRACLNTATTRNTSYVVTDSKRPYKFKFEWTAEGVVAYDPPPRGVGEPVKRHPLPRNKFRITHEEAEQLNAALRITYGLKMLRAKD